MTENNLLTNKLEADNEIDLEAGDNSLTFCVNERDAGQRIDRFLAEKLAESRSFAVKLIESGAVTVSNKSVSKNHKMSHLDTVTVHLPEPVACEAVAEDIPINIVYEDSDIIVVNKPAGMIVHPATNIYTGTLVNALLYHCGSSLSGIGGVIRPGIVHRIDKDTSGLLVVAKNDEAHASLSEQLKTHDVSRIYHAIVIGNVKDDEGTIDRPIGRHPVDRKRMAVLTNQSAGVRNAITHYTVLERFTLPTGRFTHIRCQLETGRTHQIRVHLSSIGHPLMGDEAYGGGKTKFEASNRPLLHGQCLHAAQLMLTHPKTEEFMQFSAPLPQNFEELLQKLRRQSL